MDTFQKLIRFLGLVVLLGLGLSLDARADYAALVGWEFQHSPQIIVDDAGADAYCKSNPPGSSWPDAKFDKTPGNEGCKYDYRGGTVNWNGYSVPKVYYCGSAGTGTATSVTSSPHTCTGTQPAPPVTCKVGDPGQWDATKPPSSVLQHYCVNTCEFEPSTCSGDGKTQAVRCFGTVASATNCTGSDPNVPNPTPPPPNACGAGMCKGTVNGVEVCLKCGDPGTTPTVVSKDTTKTTNGTGTPTGSKDVTKETTCSGTDCKTTTTETTKDGNGVVTGISVGTSSSKGSGNPVTDFCKDNPTAVMCKGSSWGGTCATAFTCDGDAIQCAQAQAEWEQRCAQKTLEDPTNPAIVQVNTDLWGPDGGLGPNAAKDALNKDGAKDVNIWTKFTTAQQNYIVMTKTCTPSMSFDYKGHTYTFDISMICELGVFIRLMVHIMAYLTVAKLLSRTFPG